MWFRMKYPSGIEWLLVRHMANLHGLHYLYYFFLSSTTDESSYFIGERGRHSPPMVFFFLLSLIFFYSQCKTLFVRALD